MNGLQKFCLGLVGLLAMGLSVNGQAQTTVEYIHTDSLGTPVAVTDASGNVIERSDYDPYGKLLNRPLADGPGFTGHVQDAATSLTYMQQRYYDNDAGNFLSVDPITAYSHPIGSFNPYGYASNNPYKFTDPDGRAPRGAFSDLCSSGGGNGCSSHYVADGPYDGRPSRDEMMQRGFGSPDIRDYDQNDPTFHKYVVETEICRTDSAMCGASTILRMADPSSAPRNGVVVQGRNDLWGIPSSNPVWHVSGLTDKGNAYMLNLTAKGHDYHAGAVSSFTYVRNGSLYLRTEGFGYSRNQYVKWQNYAVGNTYFKTWQVAVRNKFQAGSGD